ncbi:FtsX-like permease family protein [candidate division KSB1 bacterium]|nr:ABC transporter permease [candidate division KSB1 bacterium]RQW03903.1 MAG: FtsX-like permease family protein [candidate division KSB1 bacterium]
MLKNYFLVALRNLLRQKGYSIINITGLAIGISCALIITLLVQDELSYDRFFPNAERIYRITLNANVQSKEFRTARSSGPVAARLMAHVPEVEAATHIRSRSGTPTANCSVRYGDNAFIEYHLFFTDSSFFKVFTCEVLEGDVNTFLTEPNTVVMTDAMARKYFGDEPALGKVLEIDNKTSYTVCGVVKGFPQQSHWRFTFLASLSSISVPEIDSWINNTWYTYALLKEGTSARQAEATFLSTMARQVGPQIESMLGGNWQEMEAKGMYYQYRFQPVTDIHLHSKLDEDIFAPGNIATVYMFEAIAVFVLLIACINFMNLSTARSARRAKEVGVRKVLGSKPRHLIILFLAEAILLSCAAMILSLGLLEFVLPSINTFIGKSLSLALFMNTMSLVWILIFTLFVGLLAGLYPAIFLSNYHPVKVLEGDVLRGMRSSTLRGLLVVSQFAISIALIIGTFVVFRQLHFVQSRDLGFDKDHMLVVDNTWLLGKSGAESFKQALLSRPGIQAAAFTQNLPGNDISSAAYRRAGDDKSNIIMLRQLWCDYDFLPFLNVGLKDGRYFSRDYATDLNSGILINERTAALLGYENPVGEKIVGFFGDGERRFDIIGLIEDMHYEPLYLPIAPMVVLLSDAAPTRIVLQVRGDIPEILKAIKTQWMSYSGGQPFTPFFLNDRLQQYYHGDSSVGTLFSIFAFIGIFLSCLGLLGLATFATEQRTKEIGIRKILGATSGGILGLLSLEFIKLVIIANLIAWPAAWFFMSKWLQNFAYRINMSAWIFLMAGLVALLIALLSVSYQVIRAAAAHPVKSLRYE